MRVFLYSRTYRYTHTHTHSLHSPPSITCSPTLTRAGQSVVAERLEFVLRMSISRDRLYVSIKFGVDAEDCRYPGVNFVKSWDSSTCQDVFHGSIPFSSLTLCGVEFSDSEGSCHRWLVIACR